MTIDQALATTHRAVWALGDYALIAEEVMAPLGPILVAATGMGMAHRVLDVAAGSGNISLPAAKTGATVSSTDLTPGLLQRSKARAADLAWRWTGEKPTLTPCPSLTENSTSSCLGSA
jgi:2-polyprenyl-3-methyl-5-hydroxy-6-metoxy-1,4-benzoquinol methylase